MTNPNIRQRHQVKDGKVKIQKLSIQELGTNIKNSIKTELVVEDSIEDLLASIQSGLIELEDGGFIFFMKETTLKVEQAITNSFADC